MKIRFASCDRHEQLDAKNLTQALQEVYSGQAPHIIDVESGSSDRVVIISSEALTAQRAQAIHDQWYDSLAFPDQILQDVG